MKSAFAAPARLPPPAYYPALTGVRAVAAYLIFFFHLAQTTPEINGWFRAFVLQWHVGVSIFFVLSGFLITQRYAQRIQPTGRWALRYLQNRFARIYPVYFLLTAGSFLLFSRWPHHAFYEWPLDYGLGPKATILFFNLTLTRGYFQDLSYTGLPTAWSLTVEETFYLVAPLILLHWRGQWWRLAGYPVVFLIVGGGLVALCSRVALPFRPMAGLPFMLSLTFFGRSTEFVLGMALSLWLGPRPTPSPGRGRFTAAGVSSVLLFLAIAARAQALGPDAPLHHSSYAAIFANHFVFPLLVCVVFYGLLTERTLVRRVLETRLFALAGRSSYVLYLIHLGVFNDWFTIHVSSTIFVKLLTYSLVSVVLYKTIEQPLQQRLRARDAPQL